MVTTAKTQLGGDYITPSTVKELLSITPYAIPTTLTADIPMYIQLELESDDVDLAPTKIAVLVGGTEDASYTLAANTMIYKTYDINAPLSGGDVIKAYGTNIVDPTTDAYFGAGILISDSRTGKPQTFWTNPAALNNYGTGNDSFVAGATYRFNNCARITKIYGLASGNTTRTASDSKGGNIKLESPDFKTNLPQIYPYQVVVENAVAAGGEFIPTALLWNVNLPTDPIVAITEYLDQEGLTAAGGIAWISGVGYNKNRRTR